MAKMTKYVVVDVEKREAKMIVADGFEKALGEAGLKSGQIDWGTLGRTRDGRTISIILYEFGLKTKEMGMPEPRFWALGRTLYSGNALVTAADVQGEDANMLGTELEILRKGLTWFTSREAVETCIGLGTVDRPKVMVNEEVIWEWNK